MSNISDAISEYFPFIKVTNKFIWASTKKDNRNLPIVTIKSKDPLVALFLKFNDDSIEIKSIINSTEQRGIATDVLKSVLSQLSDGQKIIIDNDVSGGYWNKIIKKYPNFNWIFS
jgi:hypothetical protein